MISSTIKPLFRGPSDQGTPLFRGPLMRGHLSSGDLWSGDTSLQGTCDQGTPLFRGPLIRGHLSSGDLWSGDTSLQGTPLFRGHLSSGDTSLQGTLSEVQGCPLIRGFTVIVFHIAILKVILSVQWNLWCEDTDGYVHTCPYMSIHVHIWQVSSGRCPQGCASVRTNY